MNKTYKFLAFDLGATSGRAILGELSDGRLSLREVHRFANHLLEIDSKFYWDFEALWGELRSAMGKLSNEKEKIDAIGIDTWGVDVLYIGANGLPLTRPRSYRDPYTNGAPEAFFKLIPSREVYELTGSQILNFNTLYQLFAAHRENSPELAAAKTILFMPDALAYMLTGRKVCEYTIASTSQFLNPSTQKIERSLLQAAGVDPNLLPELVMPGQVVGLVSENIAQEFDLKGVPVIAVGGHDTASAVAAVPARGRNFAYLSSGTWSLMGIELSSPMITDTSFAANFTNEAGVEGTTRFLKNITGMWLLEQCRKEWSEAGRSYDYPGIVAMTRSAAPFRSLVDPDAAELANPNSMSDAIADLCRRTGQPVPQSDAEFMRTIFESLALKYRYVIGLLKDMSPFEIECLHVIGGGSQNSLLNQMAADAIALPVIAGPSEATAIGNILMQARGLGVLESLDHIREVVRSSVDLERFEPTNTAAWDQATARFALIINK